MAVVDESTRESMLDVMERGGIRGVRLNLETFGETDPEAARARLRATIARVKARGWHVQVYTRLSVIEAVGDDIRASDVPIVVDHFGAADAALGVAQPGFQTLVGLVQSGKAYVKISGAYRCSANGPDYADVAPFARALVAANPQRIVWGSDWPHPDSSRVPGRAATDVAPLLPIDDGRLLNQLAVWVPDAEHEALRDLVRAREAAKKDQLRARHRLGKFLLRRGRRPSDEMHAWTQAHPGDIGLTCCHGDDLRDVGGPFYSRIDYVLMRNGFRAVAAGIVGQKPGDRLGWLWPSDHAGVWARLLLP